MSKQISLPKKNYNPEKIADMTAMASVLKRHIVSNGLYCSIKNKNYAYVEGWQFAGGLMGLFPRVVAIHDLSRNAGKEIELRWRADVEIVEIKTNRIISNGFALCSSKENKKKDFDEYAILSMAQTRAIGKAYRNLIGWVMKLAGYEGTPSEEMHKAGEVIKEAPIETTHGLKVDILKTGQVIGPDGKPTYICSKTDEPITDEVYQYSMKIYGHPLSREAQKSAKKLKK